MTKKTVIKKTIAHWKRMIVWAEKQNKRDRLSWAHTNMDDELKESWGSKYCPFCKEYHNCLACPLYIKYGDCENSKSKNAWYSAAHAVTWAGWLYHAKRLLKQIESLPTEEDT